MIAHREPWPANRIGALAWERIYLLNAKFFPWRLVTPHATDRGVCSPCPRALSHAADPSVTTTGRSDGAIHDRSHRRRNQSRHLEGATGVCRKGHSGRFYIRTGDLGESVPHNREFFMSAEVLAPPSSGWPEWVVTTKSRWPKWVGPQSLASCKESWPNAVRQAVGESLRRPQTDGTEHAALRRYTAMQSLQDLLSARRTRSRCD
jgi:hypothetical protein